MRILVTGISGGIGRAFRERAAHEPGWVVEGLARRPAAHDHVFDVTWPPSRLQEAVDWVPSLDVICCLAGADILSPPLRQASYLERLDALYQVDLAGTVKTVQALLPKLSYGGTIIVMGWDRASLGKAGEPGELYALAKGALTSWAKSLALTLSERATVYVVAPGWIRTRWGNSLTKEQQSRIASRTRLGRWQTPEDVAEVLVALIKFPRGLATGQVVYVNGGDVLPS